MKRRESSFTLTPRQIWGIAILLMLIIFAVACWRLLPFFNNEAAQPDKQLIAWSENKRSSSFSEAAVVYPNTAANETTDNILHTREDKKQVRLFFFDPNTASIDDFVALGLRPKVAQTIINYRSKGGKFYKKEDFSKIYTLSKEDYQRLLPYINITSITPRKYETHQTTSAPHQPKSSSYDNDKRYPTKTNKPVHVNSATAEELMSLKGIGTGYANRIIKYREILGGYHKIEQLKEVYGMSDSLYEAIKPFIIIEPENIRPIAVNTATEEELYKHPYIRKMARHIVAYRNEIGEFRQIEEFRQVPLINEEIYRKLVPYLSLKK